MHNLDDDIILEVPTGSTYLQATVASVPYWPVQATIASVPTGTLQATVASVPTGTLQASTGHCSFLKGRGEGGGYSVGCNVQPHH